MSPLPQKKKKKKREDKNQPFRRHLKSFVFINEYKVFLYVTMLVTKEGIYVEIFHSVIQGSCFCLFVSYF